MHESTESFGYFVQVKLSLQSAVSLKQTSLMQDQTVRMPFELELRDALR